MNPEDERYAQALSAEGKRIADKRCQLNALEEPLKAAGYSLLDFAEFLNWRDRRDRRDDQGKRILKVLTIRDIREFPDPRFLIDNVLIEGTITLLGSYAGKGKTVLALSLMRSVLDGFPWLGRYKVNRTGPVLLINEENPDSVLKVYTRKIDAEALFCCLHFQNIQIDSRRGCAELEEVIRRIRPVLVVIDSLIRVHSHDEDASIEMAQVIKHLREIANRGVTILLLHHHNKGTGNLEHRARGSSDIPAGVDLELSLYEKKERLILQSVKTRFAPFEAIHLQIVGEDGVPEVRLESSLKEEVRQAVRECTTVEPVDFATIRDYVAGEGIEIGERSLRDMLREMKELIVMPAKQNRKLYKLGSLAELGK